MKRMVALALLAMLGACTRGGGNEATNAQLVIAQIQEPRSLNPLYLDGVISGEMNGLVYSYLTTYDFNGGMIPQAATLVPTIANGGISHDGLHVTYRLRRGIRWQDGAPLTSRDVAFTFNAIMNPDNATLSRYGYDAVASVETPDAYTVRVDLKKPLAGIVSYFFGGDSNYGLLPAHLLARYKSLDHVAFNAAPIGSGPYRVVEWERGDHLTFEANPSYFLGAPAIRRIVAKFVPDSQTIVNLLSTGDVQAVFFADVTKLDQMRKLPRTRLVFSPTTIFQTLQFNTQDPIISDPVVRRALAMGIDRETITTKLLKGIQNPNTGMRGLFTWAYDPSAGNIPYDPSGAGKLLDADGWRMGSDGIRHKHGVALDVSYIMYSGTAVYTSLATVITDYASKIGIRMRIKTMTPVAITAPDGPLYQGRFQVAQFLEQSNVDPDAAWIIGCDQRAPHGFNFTRYCDPQTQALLNDGSSTFDRARRLRDYAQVQRRLLKEVPMLFLYQATEIDAVPNNLGGYRQSMYTSPWTFAYRWRLTDTANR